MFYNEKSASVGLVSLAPSDLWLKRVPASAFCAFQFSVPLTRNKPTIARHAKTINGDLNLKRGEQVGALPALPYYRLDSCLHPRVFYNLLPTRFVTLFQILKPFLYCLNFVWVLWFKFYDQCAVRAQTSWTGQLKTHRPPPYDKNYHTGILCQAYKKMKYAIL